MADGEDAPSQRKSARHQGPLCVVARLETRIGAERSVQAALQKLARAVRAEEVGCTGFHLTRPLGTAGHFVVHARFSDWRAFEAHAETAHMECALAHITPELTAPMALEIFLEV
jgi:quinol monooxygenase YgiN